MSQPMKSTFVPTQPSRYRGTSNANGEGNTQKEYKGLIQQLEETLGKPLLPDTRQHLEIAMHNIVTIALDFQIRCMKNAEAIQNDIAFKTAEYLENQYGLKPIGGNTETEQPNPSESGT